MTEYEIKYDLLTKKANYAIKYLRSEDANLVLREIRDLICFSITDRGTLWYKSLTYTQSAELEKWHTAWKDITKTHVVPARPVWLKN